MIALYKKGRTHIIDERDCTVVLVPTNEDRRALLEQGDHFDTIEDLYAPTKPKKPRGKAGEKAAEVVESEDETESGAAENEDENRSD